LDALRKSMLVLLVLVLLTVMVTTWGSIGSAVIAMCLLMMGAELLYQHFLNNRDENDWQTE